MNIMGAAVAVLGTLKLDDLCNWYGLKNVSIALQHVNVKRRLKNSPALKNFYCCRQLPVESNYRLFV